MTGILELHNFRNYHRARMEFKPGVNAIIGDNGVGKTNLLESLFFLVTEKAARTNDISELIEHGEEEARVEGVFHAGREIVKRMVIDKEGGVRKKGRTEDIGTVFFQPDDMWMVKGGPEARRRNIDAATMEMKKGYRDTLREYQRALRQRNEAIRAVRKGVGEREIMRNWNPLLYRYGSSIVKERTNTSRGLEREMKRLSEKWGKGTINLRYYTSMGDAVDDEAKTMEKIEKMGEATDEERLRWKYVPQGEKLAAKYLTQDSDLTVELSQYDKNVIGYVIEGVTDILIRNISLPKDELAKRNTRQAMEGLKTIKSDKVAVENVYSKMRRIFSHYAEQGEQQRKQAYASLKSEFEAKMQQVIQQQLGTLTRMTVNAEKEPQFQEEWRKLKSQLDLQYSKLLDEYKQELSSIS